VNIKGYAVRDRIVVGVYNYAPITTFTLPVGGATNNMFAVTALDYLATEVPRDAL
jgi:hypothetical protein